MVIDPIIKRRAVREYSDASVSDESIKEIIMAGEFAPTAVNNRSVEFLVIKSKENKEALYKIIEPKQEFLKHAPVWIIPLIDTAKSRLPIQDLSVATENMLIEATALGLGSVWRNIEPLIAENIKKLLDVPDNFMIINIVPLGYAKTTPKPHNEEDFSENKIHYEKWR